MESDASAQGKGSTSRIPSRFRRLAPGTGNSCHRRTPGSRLFRYGTVSHLRFWRSTREPCSSPVHDLSFIGGSRRLRESAWPEERAAAS